MDRFNFTSAEKSRLELHLSLFISIYLSNYAILLGSSASDDPAAAAPVSREDYIASVAKDIYNKIPLTSIDIGTYDLNQIRTILG